jgi:sortase (surface protein transpeptidase)
VEISIPELGIGQNLIGLRVSPDGTMQVPSQGGDIGWWSKGPAPGEPGAAVLAGHVVLGGEPGVFARLAELPDGAEVTVRRSDGSVATYRVTGREQFPKDDFPDDLIYRLDGPSALHLVTCGGEIDPADGHYRDNVIVFAEPVSDTAPYAPA